MRRLLILAVASLDFTCVTFSQHSFSDSSHLKDPAYVRENIREISDSNLWNSIDLSRPGLERIRRQALDGKFEEAARSWASYWQSKRQAVYVTETQQLLLDTDMLTDVESFRASMSRSQVDRDTIFARAGMILRNAIRTWGDTVLQFGEKVDFNRETGQSGKYGFHYWYWCRPLLMAWLLSGDDRYPAKFENLFNTWYEQRNSITHWFPDLDVVYYELGLGVRNRTFIEFYLQRQKSWSLQTHTRMLKTILAAGRWLYELERWEGYRPGNWQIHGSYMLSQIAMVFPEFRESHEWLRMGLLRMSQHLDQDFFADGGHSERCPRNYSLATYLSFRNLAYLLDAYGINRDLSLRIRASMGKTIDWWLAMLTPTGEVPAINDSHRGLFPTRILKDGSRIFDKPDVNGILQHLLHEPVGANAPLPPFISRHMPASGFSIMRSDWTPQALYLSVNYGPAAGFHTHFDLLDVELYAYGKPLAVDAGLGLTYDDPLYEPWYRSSRSHNMVVVNDSNIARDNNQGENVHWGSTGSLDYFSGEHHGYARFGVRERRQIAFVKPSYWFMLDDLECNRSGDTLSWYFHSPTPLQPSGDGFVSATAPGIAVMPVGRQFPSRTGSGWAASTSVLIPGKTELIPWIRFDQIGSRDSTCQFAVLLSPFRASDHKQLAQRISSRHFSVTSDERTDHLYFAGGKFTDGTVETDAQFVLISLNSRGSAGYSLIEGTYLRYGGKPLWSAAKQGTAEGIFVP